MKARKLSQVCDCDWDNILYVMLDNVDLSFVCLTWSTGVKRDSMTETLKQCIYFRAKAQSTAVTVALHAIFKCINTQKMELKKENYKFENEKKYPKKPTVYHELGIPMWKVTMMVHFFLVTRSMLSHVLICLMYWWNCIAPLWLPSCIWEFEQVVQCELSCIITSPGKIFSNIVVSAKTEDSIMANGHHLGNNIRWQKKQKKTKKKSNNIHQILLQWMKLFLYESFPLFCSMGTRGIQILNGQSMFHLEHNERRKGV